MWFNDDRNLTLIFILNFGAQLKFEAWVFILDFIFLWAVNNEAMADDNDGN